MQIQDVWDFSYLVSVNSRVLNEGLTQPEVSDFYDGTNGCNSLLLIVVKRCSTSVGLYYVGSVGFCWCRALVPGVE